MTTYIKDLIDLPERVHGGDFVLRLAEGVENPGATLAQYVVTPQLETSFDRALDFIRAALESTSSKAAYLHGSFGSGKSHFMAVLHCLLRQLPEALSMQGLESVVGKHQPWLAGRRFLLVPFHMIGQPNLEAAIFGGYVEHVMRLDPNGSIPPVYKAEGLLDDARRFMQSMGENAFFDGLNAGGDTGGAGSAGGAASTGGGGWGALGSTWDRASFEDAARAAPDSEDRGRLVSALVDTHFRSYRDVMRGGREAFVSLDEGLSIISRDAKARGYDALILFLDELILWLATHATEDEFLNLQCSNLTKLVEAEHSDRPAPIVSFVARQRNLRELVGNRVTGSDELRFDDILGHFEARFDTITLEDRNLPEIAARRILSPRSEAARQQVQQAYEQTEKVRDDVLSVLLTPRADRAMFRKVYPFSPALVETLVAVSSVLQRERTALKVMLQLLVDQRDSLELGQVVPVGDLFDVIAGGDQPFTEGMRVHFENAKRLYDQKLAPMLAKECDLEPNEAATLAADDSRFARYRAGDRLLKTLLLAALVPEVAVLKELTPARLAALNHGSIKVPIAGREAKTVLARCRDWSAQVGELKITGDEANPTISLHLSGVDTESILANAQGIDNPGNRRRLLRDLLYAELGIASGDELFMRHAITWRGTTRDFEVMFGNVREATTETLSTDGDARKLMIDFPFDDGGHTVDEDLARLDRFRAEGKAARTLLWLPAFLSRSAQADLGTLVKIEHILAGERFRDFAKHLPSVEQTVARDQLRSQGDALRQRLMRYLAGAYGADTATPGSVDTTHSPGDHFQSLDPAFSPRPPVGANLRAALEHLLGQMLASQYPAHPEFAAEVRKPTLRRVHEQVEHALQDPGGRTEIDRPLRPLMHQVAVPLQLGQMGEAHFALGRHWYTHFTREVQGEVTVGRLRAAMDKPQPMGLPADVQNLVILTYAAQANLVFVLHGGPYPSPGLDNLPDELELREQALPDEATWREAIERAGQILGITVSELRNAANVAKLVAALGERASDSTAGACGQLAARLAHLGNDLTIPENTFARLHTAKAVTQTLKAIAGAEERERVAALCAAPLETSMQAMRSSYGKAAEVLGAIEGANWTLFEAVAGLTDSRAAAAEGIRTDLLEALSHDEYAVGLAPKLRDLEGRAVRLLADTPKPPPPAPPRPGDGEAPGATGGGVSPPPGGSSPGADPGLAPPPTPPPGTVEVDRVMLEGASSADARERLAALARQLEAEPGLKADVQVRLYREGGKQ